MLKIFAAAFCIAMSLAVSTVSSSAQRYGIEDGMSTDPNCYRGPRQVYVCGNPRSGADYQGGYRRRGYALDEDGRSTDPNCYRGPNQVYVCGGRQGGEYGRGYRRREYGYDQFGRSTDPNCYRGRGGAYVC